MKKNIIFTILLVLISLNLISQESFSKINRDSVCFTVNEAREIVRWNEERKHIKDVSSKQYNKIKILERQIQIKDTIYVESEIIRDTLIKEVEVYHEKYKSLIIANQALHREKLHYRNKFKIQRKRFYVAFSSSLALLALLIFG